MLDRGNSRSDRCERHRKAHRLAIQALAVPYVNLSVIGEVFDRDHPTGPLGSLGPLPVLHTEHAIAVDLGRFEFGMTDRDVLAILEGLRDKQVAVIEAGTGTGKSTFMPFRLMNPPPGAPFRLSTRGPIVVTEPRVAAAKGVARFVGEELCFAHDSRTCVEHIGPGFAVGYQVKGEKHWDGACQLVYVTDGTMINWVRDGQLARIGAVIIDEAHERSENIDIILAQLRATIRNHKHLRVIITSATLDRNFFVEYFGGPDEVFHLSVPPTKTFGYGVPMFIDARMDDDMLAKGLTIGASTASMAITFDGWSEWGPEQDGYPRENLRQTTRQLQALRCTQAIPLDKWKDSMPSAVARQVVAIAKGTEWGDILSFLPTTASIEKAITEINEALASCGLKKSFDVYPLLASTDKSVSDKATAARSRGQKRKIVVSSNLAETSLTVKGVRYVVDSGLICQSEWDAQLASGSLPTKPHSQSGVRQRWGRVGRDAPGWVFPLYTVEQFLALPRSTPPGSAQTNLESFYMKLIAAGINVEEAALPANFQHESIARDEDAVRVVETFNRESTRAQRALRLAGAVDNEGDLTEYGRDLERFPGTGSEALALMLAEQLACIHEVALALHVLGQGRVFGKRGSCVLQIDPLWPAAWRVAAAQRHRGLAVGCGDDLDVLLRVCDAWQRADDPAEWCATWWVNEVALRTAWTDVMNTVKSVSAAMKAEAFRQVEPALAGRARAVLSRAMVSLRYERVNGTQFRGLIAGAEAGETVTLSRAQMVETADRILAFNRFRPTARDEHQPREAYISHTVRVVEWAENAEADPDDMGLDLIVRAASHARDERVSDSAKSLEVVRARFPIGTILELELDVGSLHVRSAEVFPSVFRRPPSGGSSVRSSETSSGFDPDWDPIGALARAEIPEEEETSRLLDPRVNEVNDGVLARPEGQVLPPRDRDEVSSLPPLYAAAAWESAPLSTSVRGRVVGYQLINEVDETERLVAENAASRAQIKEAMAHVDRLKELMERAPASSTTNSGETERAAAHARLRNAIENARTLLDGREQRSQEISARLAEIAAERASAGREDRDPQTVTRGRAVALAIEPLRSGAPVDPAKHPDLQSGRGLTVRVCGTVNDYERDFLQVARVDDLGSFYLDAASGGLNYYDRTFLSRLVPGATLSGLVVVDDDTGALTISLLPAAHAHLAQASTESLPINGAPTPFYLARIRELANQHQKVRIELEHDSRDTGLSHQFEVHLKDLRSAQVPEVLDGSLLVALGRDPKRRPALTIRRPSDTLDAFLRAHSGAFAVKDDRIELGPEDVSPALIKALEEFDRSPEWRVEVWEFYTASLRRVVRDVRPQLAREYATCRPTIASLLRERQRDFQERYGVSLISAAAANRIEIRSLNPTSAVAAAAVIKDLDGRPCIVAALPPGTVGRVLGARQENRKRLEARAGVLWVWIDADRVGIVGESDHAVEQTLQAIRASVEKTTGELYVPTEKIGRLIGQKGARIQGLKDASGCQAWNPDNGNKWIVEGPSYRAVEEFFRLARPIVGETGRIVSSRTLRIIENTIPTKKTAQRTRSEKRPAPPQAQAKKPDSLCFIATACYGSGDHPDVVVLRHWRDRRLLRSFAGRRFVGFYYRWSPVVARYLEQRKGIARMVRTFVLQPLARLLRSD